MIVILLFIGNLFETSLATCNIQLRGYGSDDQNCPTSCDEVFIKLNQDISYASTSMGTHLSYVDVRTCQLLSETWNCDTENVVKDNFCIKSTFNSFPLSEKDVVMVVVTGMVTKSYPQNIQLILNDKCKIFKVAGLLAVMNLQLYFSATGSNDCW